ncbi:MAG: CvpA family protein [Deltaproteobacteria bacterium]|nr:CvpA family protein [Deltaproteobacteria bacterium]
MPNFWDIVVVAFVGWRVHAGWARGIIMEVFRLLALAAGSMGAIWGAAKVENFFDGLIGHGPGSKLIALAVAFAIIALCVMVIGMAATKIAHALFLSTLNKSLGAAFGVLSGFALALVLSLLLMAFDTGQASRYVGSSLTGRIAYGAASAVSAVLPGEILRHLRGGKNTTAPTPLRRCAAASVK